MRPFVLAKTISVGMEKKRSHPLKGPRQENNIFHSRKSCFLARLKSSNYLPALSAIPICYLRPVFPKGMMSV